MRSGHRAATEGHARNKRSESQADTTGLPIHNPLLSRVPISSGTYPFLTHGTGEGGRNLQISAQPVPPAACEAVSLALPGDGQSVGDRPHHALDARVGGEPVVEGADVAGVHVGRRRADGTPAPV